MNGPIKTHWMQTLFSICILISLVAGTTSCMPQPTAAPQIEAPTAAVVATVAPATVASPTQAPATLAPATEVPTVAKEPVFMTVNVEQVSTWMRNFNPFSPDVRYPAQAGMYEPLMNYNKSTGKLVPWLATEYAWNADNTALTFKIRQGVKWSDGQPFTAKDVIFTFDMLKKKIPLLRQWQPLS